MFSYLAQMSIHEYIKRRRLSLAALDCVQTKGRILDIAIKYGFQSNDSFTRAFVSCHGITPSKLRKDKQKLTIYPILSFQLTVKGSSAMNVKIVEKEAFNLVGISKRVPIVFNGVNPAIVEMVKRLDEHKIEVLKSINNCEPKGIVSASYDFSTNRMSEEGELSHLIGVHSYETSVDKFTVLNVKKSTWAVFEVRGSYPQAVQNIWGRIYSEWFLSTPYESINGPEILWNEGIDITKPDYHSEIWIPVKLKV